MKKDEINAIIAYIENTLMENLRTNNVQSIDGLLNIIHGYDKLKMLAGMGDTINTDNKTCIEKLVKVLNDYSDDKETATQMEEAIEMAIYLLVEEE